MRQTYKQKTLIKERKDIFYWKKVTCLKWKSNNPSKNDLVDIFKAVDNDYLQKNSSLEILTSNCDLSLPKTIF